MKRSIRALLLIISCVASSSAFAENPMKTVFGDMMSNSTSATTFNTAKRFGATGGGFSARIPRVTPNIISVVPPKLNVGCGGIDFFTGSFSIINKDQMVQVMRGIANGAATYAFSVGMQAVCATCMSTLESLSDTLNELNAKSRDACTATNDMLSNSKLGKETMNQVRENSLINPQAIFGGFFSDQGEADTFTGNKTNAVVTANPQVAKDMEYNLVWDQLNEQTVQNWAIEGVSYNWRELIQSLLGTMIVSVKADSSGEKVIKATPKTATMTARDLLLSADQVTVLRCDEAVKCMNPGPVTVADWKGLAQTISERLILLHPALHNRQSLTPSDQKFLSILTVEFLTYLEKTPPGLATHNIELFSKVIANEVISSSIKSFIVRLKHWMGTNALDKQVAYIDQLNKAMDDLGQQMEAMTGETALAQQRLANNLATMRFLVEIQGQGK